MGLIKRLAFWGLIAWLIASLAGCGSIPDPSDFDRLRKRVGALSDEEADKLEKAGRAASILAVVKRFDWPPGAYLAIYECKQRLPDGREGYVHVDSLLAKHLHAWLEVFAEWGFGSASDFMRTWMADIGAHFRNKTIANRQKFAETIDWSDCRWREKHPRLEALEVQVNEDLKTRGGAKSDRVSDTTLYQLLAGLIATTALSPEMILFLCTLDGGPAHVYCPDNVPPGAPPPPPPTEPSPYPGDGL